MQQGLAEFIGPDVAPSAIDQPTQPRVIIVSAAGAAGKSTLAQAVAFKKQAPIWDLAQASAVGENSMTGQLTASFGFSLASQVSTHLGAGTLFLIVDALDEARVKANQAGFEAFIQDIAAIAKNGNGPAFVLLGRTQTAEMTWILLAEAGISTSLLSIQPFTRTQAEQYIEARLRNFDESAASRIANHPQPFVEARDLVLDQLELAVGGEVAINEEASREFLGYAPVLETVAVLLAKESNFQEFSAGLRSVSSKVKRQTDRPLAVLEHVIDRLLEREQRQKLQANIRPALEAVAAEAGWSDWDSLYSPDEQKTRLLGLILSRELTACPAMPASVRARYEEQLKAWLPEHPFLRDGKQSANKVFESYLFAIAMREYLTPLSGFVEQQIMARNYKPSRLLADFYILLGEQSGNEVVAKRQIGLLYDSLLAGETDSLRVRLSIEAGDPDESDEEESAVNSEGEFELVYLMPGAAVGEQVEARSFKIVEENGMLSFGRQLKEAAIVTRGTISLGGTVDDFEVGPAVDIRSDVLEIHSSGIVIRGAAKKSTTESDAVLFDARKCESAVSRKPVIRGGSLAVRWPHAEVYPWNEFVLGAPDDDADGDEMHEVSRRFRRIVGSLRSHSKGSLARFKDKVEHRRVLKNDLGRALLAKLVADGVLTLEKDFYHWGPERGDALLKVSWHGLRNRHVTPEMRAYFSQFIAENKKLF